MRMDSEDGKPAPYAERLLVAFVGLVCRWPVVTLTCALVAACLSVFVAWTQLQFHTQRSDLLSPNKDCVQRLQKHIAEFGDDDDMVVLVQGADRAKMELALEHLAAQIALEPKYFDRLFYKCDLRGLRNRALLFLPAEQIVEGGREHEPVRPLECRGNTALVGGEIDQRLAMALREFGEIMRS